MHIKVDPLRSIHVARAKQAVCSVIVRQQAETGQFRKEVVINLVQMRLNSCRKGANFAFFPPKYPVISRFSPVSLQKRAFGRLVWDTDAALQQFGSKTKLSHPVLRLATILFRPIQGFRCRKPTKRQAGRYQIAPRRRIPIQHLSCAKNTGAMF